MKKKYQALQPIGRFEKGDIVGGLTDAEIKHHLMQGNIKENILEEAKPTITTAKAKAGEVKHVE